MVQRLVERITIGFDLDGAAAFIADQRVRIFDILNLVVGDRQTGTGGGSQAQRLK